MYATNGTDVHLARIQLRPLDPASDAPVRSVTTAVPPPARAGAAPEHRLRGRRGERETLDRLVASVRAGNSRTLVVRGEAGAGKTALLEYLLQHAWGCRVAQAAGVETEMELPFAGLHQLCAPFLDRLERLPESAARRTRHRVQPAGRGRAGSLRGRPGRPGPAVGGGRGAPAGLRRGRCAVAGSGLGAGARVRRAPSGGRAGRGGLRGAPGRRRAGPGGTAGTGGPRAGRR